MLQVSTRESAPRAGGVRLLRLLHLRRCRRVRRGHWFRDRLLALRATVLKEPDAYFHRFAGFPEEEVVDFAEQIWRDINLVNLRENIAPTKGRAHLILEKDSAHRVHRLQLRRP